MVWSLRVVVWFSDLMGLLISDLMAFGGWCVVWWWCMVFVAGVVVGCRGCWGFNGF